MSLPSYGLNPMKPLRMILAGILAFALVPLFAAEDPAKIIVYVPWDSLQHSRLKVSFDEVPVAEVQPGRFFVINGRPGSHVLIAGNGIPAVIEARANENFFICVTRHIEIGQSGKVGFPALEVLSAEQARHDLINLVYISPKKIFSSAVSKTDPFSRAAPRLRGPNSQE